MAWAFYNMKLYNNLHNYNAFLCILYIIYNDIFVKEKAFPSKNCSFINLLLLILVLGKRHFWIESKTMNSRWWLQRLGTRNNGLAIWSICYSFSPYLSITTVWNIVSEPMYNRLTDVAMNAWHNPNLHAYDEAQCSIAFTVT